MSDPVEKRAAFEAPLDLARQEPRDPRMPRPSTTTVGSVFVLLRALAGFALAAAMWLAWDEVADVLDITVDGDYVDLTRALVIGAIVFFALVDLALAALVYRGVNWARITVMIVATFSILTAFASWWAGDEQITLTTTLLTLSLDILLMLALSARSARAYSRRTE